MGERALTKLQWGKETAHGTAVAADTILLIGEIPQVTPDRDPVMIQDDAGVRSDSVRASARIDNLLVKDSFTVPDAYFQILPILFSMGIKGGVTPAEQTSSQNDMLWTHTPSQTATNAPDSGTIEIGDDIQAYEAEYMMIERINIAGVISQDLAPSPVVITVDWFGRQWTPAAFTGALTIPTTEEINAKLTRFFVDTSFAGLGGTEKTGLLRSFDIDILTGLHPKSQGGVNKYFDVHGEGKLKVISNLVLEGNSDAAAIKVLSDAGTKSFIQYSNTGSQIGSGDSQNLTIGVGGFWKTVIPLSANADGNNLHSAVHEGTYDITGAQQFTALVTTNVASI